MIKIRGLRMRILILNAKREVVRDLPSNLWDGEYDSRKAVVLQYDKRPTGRVYHAHGHQFTDRNTAWAYSVLMQTKDS